MGKGIKRYYSIIIAAAVSLISFILTTCNPTEPICPEPKPPGYQEDIPWPSLADSPWPMNLANPQSTGRSKWAGPKLGQIELVLDSVLFFSSGVIGKDTTIYIAKSVKEAGLYAIKPDGKVKWVFNFPDKSRISYSTPLIASDGTIYCSSKGGPIDRFYAINPDGTLKWFLDDISLQMSINIGPDGTIYFVQSIDQSGSFTGKLTALSKEGNTLWTYSDPKLYGGDFSHSSISPNGKTIYLYTTESRLVAFDLINRSIKWSFGNKIAGVPAVDNKGILYIIANVDTIYEARTAIFALNEDGIIKWSYPLWSRPFPGPPSFLWASNPIIDKNGNIYCGYDSLYSFSNDGKLRWRRKLCIDCSNEGILISPLICSSDNIIYASVSDLNIILNSIKAISSDGDELWSVTFYHPNPIGGLSPMIGSDNALYIPSRETLSKFYKIK